MLPGRGKMGLVHRSRARARTSAVAVAVAVALATVSVGLSGPAQAVPFSSAEVEPVALLWGTTGVTYRESLFTVQGAYGWRAGAFATYFGAGIGFFTVRLRAGLAFMPGDLREPGLLARLEVRPQIVQLQCLEMGVLGHAGLGYRWPLEYRRAEEEPGAAFYLLPAFDAGPDWARKFCINPSRSSGPAKVEVLMGGSLTLGLDW